MANTLNPPCSSTTEPVVSTTVTTESNGSQVELTDPHHIFTVAARSIHDCAELLRILKAAIAEEEQGHIKDNESQDLGNGNIKSMSNGSTNGHLNGGDCDVNDNFKNRKNPSSDNHQSTYSTVKIASILAPTTTGLKMITPCKRSEGLSPDHEWIVDYDQRSREVPMETDIDVALRELEKTQSLLENSRLSPQDLVPSNLSQPITLHATIDPSCPPSTFQSTFARELWFCSLHAVHHFAMIRVICSEFGLTLTEAFGLAPSTVKNRHA
ncbi:hypothetical protein BGZ49_005582 [Haplosporangium sp. Z 27]|nr:hypothetical protein BGZ49_005582 [Haplosporangium sp. Z 27]